MSGTRRLALGGARVLGLSTLVCRALGLLSSFVIARLLVPEDIGVFAFALGIMAIAGQVGNMDARRDILRNQGNAPARARAYVLVQATIGLVVGVAIFVGAPTLAGWLNRPESFWILRALCVWPFLEAVRLPAVALLEADLRFPSLARLEVWSGVLQVTCSIGLALAGWGAWALVVGFYAGIGVRCAGAWALEGQRIVKARSARSDLASVWTFGSTMLAASLLTTWYWNVDDVLVGSVLGFGAAGLYAYAFRMPHVLMQITDGLGRVTLPLLGKNRARDEQARIFSAATRASFALLAPFFLAGVFHGDLLVRWMFGSRWLSMVPAFQVFLTLTLLRGTLRHWSDVATVRGRQELMLYASLAVGVVLPVVGWYGARHHGITGMAVAVLIAWAIPAPFYLNWVRNELDIAFVPLLGPGFLALTAGVAIGVVYRAGVGECGDVASLAVLVVQCVTFFLVLRVVDRDLVALFRETVFRGQAGRGVDHG